MAIVIPPIGLGLATLIDHRLTGKRLFGPQLYPQGKTAMFLAFMGISEGAIPFLLENPLATLPALYMASAIAGAMLPPRSVPCSGSRIGDLGVAAGHQSGGVHAQYCGRGGDRRAVGRDYSKTVCTSAGNSLSDTL